MSDTCPKCGYCPHCKRTNPYPSGPIWVYPYWQIPTTTYPSWTYSVVPSTTAAPSMVTIQ